METKRFQLSVNVAGNWQADCIISIESKETKITETIVQRHKSTI